MMHFSCRCRFEKTKDPTNALVLGLLEDIDKVQLPCTRVVDSSCVEEGGNPRAPNSKTQALALHYNPISISIASPIIYQEYFSLSFMLQPQAHYLISCNSNAVLPLCAHPSDSHHWSGA
jgi:hypothetical protein